VEYLKSKLQTADTIIKRQAKMIQRLEAQVAELSAPKPEEKTNG